MSFVALLFDHGDNFRREDGAILAREPYTVHGRLVLTKDAPLALTDHATFMFDSGKAADALKNWRATDNKYCYAKLAIVSAEGKLTWSEKMRVETIGRDTRLWPKEFKAVTSVDFKTSTATMRIDQKHSELFTEDGQLMATVKWRIERHLYRDLVEDIKVREQSDVDAAKSQVDAAKDKIIDIEKQLERAKKALDNATKGWQGKEDKLKRTESILETLDNSPPSNPKRQKRE